MADKKIKSFKELWNFIKENNKDYLERIRQGGGRDLYFRALTAQILWLFLFYSIAQKLVPIKDFLLSNALVLIILGFFSLLWGVIKNKMPLWISEMIRGEFFYNFEIKFLNFWIGMLFIANMVLIFLPIEFYKKIYQKIKR